MRKAQIMVSAENHRARAGVAVGRSSIVVAVDDSASALYAARWAADLAVCTAAPVTLVHVVASDHEQRLTPPFLTQLSAFTGQRGAHVDVKVVRGNVVEQLEREARHASMLVLGSYGEGSWCGALAGDRALALAHASAAPLVVVRGAGPRVPPPRDGAVVVGLDATASGARALRFAAAVADVTGHPVEAVHTVCDLTVGPDGRWHRWETTTEQLVEHDRQAIERIVRGVAHRYPNVAVTTEVVASRPVEALLERAPRAWLLVTGPRPGSIEGMAGSSTTSTLIETAACPVAAVPSVTGIPYAQRVVDIMTSPVVTTSPRMRAVDAALTATLHDVTALPVLDGDALVGMFTTQALLARSAQVDQGSVLVGTVMAPCAAQVSPELSLADLARLLRRVDLRSLPVLRDGRLVGIVTEGDLRAVDSSHEDSALETTP